MYIPGSFAWKHISENKNIKFVAVVILVKRVSDQVDSASADVRRRISVWIYLFIYLFIYFKGDWSARLTLVGD